MRALAARPCVLCCAVLGGKVGGGGVANITAFANVIVPLFSTPPQQANTTTVGTPQKQLGDGLPCSIRAISREMPRCGGRVWSCTTVVLVRKLRHNFVDHTPEPPPLPPAACTNLNASTSTSRQLPVRSRSSMLSPSQHSVACLFAETGLVHSGVVPSTVAPHVQ